MFAFDRRVGSPDAGKQTAPVRCCCVCERCRRTGRKQNTKHHALHPHPSWLIPSTTPTPPQLTHIHTHTKVENLNLALAGLWPHLAAGLEAAARAALPPLLSEAAGAPRALGLGVRLEAVELEALSLGATPPR